MIEQRRLILNELCDYFRHDPYMSLLARQSDITLCDLFQPVFESHGIVFPATSLYTAEELLLRLGVEAGDAELTAGWLHSTIARTLPWANGHPEEGGYLRGRFEIQIFPWGEFVYLDVYVHAPDPLKALLAQLEAPPDIRLDYYPESLRRRLGYA